MRRLGAVSLLAVAACDRPSQHVYSSPPPPQSSAVATPATPSVPELPIGAMAPGARLVSITDAATGTPVSLGAIVDSIDVLTLVAFGPGDWMAREGGRVELALKGPSRDTLMVSHLGAPAPSIAAHTFRVPALRPGRYSTTVRLRMTDGRVIAESIPLWLEVVAR